MISLIQLFMQGGNFALLALLVLILRLPIICITLSVHEASHGLAAYKLGDPTAKYFGRLTLNPLKHFDLIGSICLLVFGIGWAKPVPVNARYFKNPKRDMALTAFAGPLSNIAMALFGIIVLRVLDITIFEGIYFQPLFNGNSLSDISLSAIISESFAVTEKLQFVVMYFFEMFAIMNIALAIFNLIPIPPFDGSRIAFAVLPDRYYFGIMKYEKIIMLVFLIAFYMFGDGFSYLVTGAFNGIYDFIALITSFLV